LKSIAYRIILDGYEAVYSKNKLQDVIMNDKPLTQLDAQNRVEQIQAFKQEITQLESDEVFLLSQEQHQKIQNYHHALTNQLSKSFDIDVTSQAKKLTLGMQIASLFGALAMAISLFFLFYQFWGYINTSLQVVILITAPVILFILSLYLSQKENSAYFSKIAALVSFACFVLNLSMLGQIFNITPSPNALFVWAAFSFLLAYACNARLLVFFAIVSLSSFIAMKFGTWNGMYWISFGERPENFFLPSLLIFIIPQLFNHKCFSGFAVIYRVMAMSMIFIPILILSNWGQISYLTWSVGLIEGFYQIGGFLFSAIAIGIGIKRQWKDVVNTGNVFFILFLYTKLFDWWWDWMPKYVFFFVLGLTSLLALVVFKRVRLSCISEDVSA